MIRLKSKREKYLTFSPDFRAATKALISSPPFRRRVDRPAGRLNSEKQAKRFILEKTKGSAPEQGSEGRAFCFFMFVPADFDHLAAGSSPRLFVL